MNPSSSARRPQEVFLVMGSNLPSDGKDATATGLRCVDRHHPRTSPATTPTRRPSGWRTASRPRITVTIDDADAFDQEEVTVKVAVDETLLSAPTLTVRRSISTSLNDRLNDADENVS